jgi:multimeric flavodoxin WrbA
VNILAINASHRGDKGQTRFFIDRLFQGTTEAGAECEVITLCRKSQMRVQCIALGQALPGKAFDSGLRGGFAPHAS